MTKSLACQKKRGFTLLEMTIALAMSMGIAATLIVFLQQQVSLATVMNRFSFLRDEAPQINTLLTTIIKKADNYRIYADLDNAKNAANPVRTGGRALRLRFRHPDGGFDTVIIVFENQNGANRLNYYLLPNGSNTWPSSPKWTITSKPQLIDFSNPEGILLIKITGSNGDEITYAGNPQ